MPGRYNTRNTYDDSLLERRLQLEILAPCGGPEHVKSAVFAGADAVYIGGRSFSARRKAANFDAGEMAEAARFCRGYGVKFYVTVNILTRDNEWDALKAYLRELAGIAPDALIIQDIGVARLCREILPEMPLHASTQLSVHSPEGVRFCEEIGFERVVIARECDKDTLQTIVNSSRIGIEAFVHGALCVSVSGQCTLSAMIGGRSGNRGLCAQPCRLDFTGGGRGYALSLKDLSLVQEVQLLVKMGICALKIEGRMKRPEYVSAAVRAVKSALSGKEARLEDLRAAFSRDGFTKGYFVGNTTGMGGLRTREDVQAMASILPRLAEEARVPSVAIPVDMEFTMENNRRCRLTVSDGADEVTLEGSVPETSVSKDVSEGEAERLLSRLGSTPFEAQGMKIKIEPGLFLPSSQINTLRRDACSQLLEKRIGCRTPRYEIKTEKLAEEQLNAINVPVLRVHCQTLEQARVMPNDCNIVLNISNAIEALREGFSAERLLVVPDRYVADEDELRKVLAVLREMGAAHLLCENVAHTLLGKELGYILYGGLGLNVFNSKSVAFWAGLGLQDVTASMELRLSECLTLKKHVPVGIAAYGQLPLMLLRRCPFEYCCKAGKTCPGALSDKTGRRFPVRCCGGYQELLNADLLWMADQLPKLNGTGFFSILLHEENGQETLEVIKAYREGGEPPQKFTRGLLTRGVE